MSRGLKLDRGGKLRIPESSLESAIFDLLTYDNFHVFRFGWAITQAGRELSEVGAPDLLALRYGLPPDWRTEVLWLEIKSATGRLSPEQRLWIIGERRRGALVWICGETFPATVEGFKEFYGASGLARRKC